MGRLRSTSVLSAVAALSLALVAAPAAAGDAPTARGAQADDFSIVVLPDTQYASKTYPDVWDSTGEWIAKEKDSRNIKYALHVGDVVNNSDENEQWMRAVKGMDHFHNSVPSIIGVGNHDMDDAGNSRDAKAFNEQFPREKFSDLPTFGGTYPADRNDNSYHTFSAGATEWLIVALKYEPTDKELEWGNKVIADHPNHQTMIVTHSYQKGNERTETGDEIWNKLVKKHKNVSFVFSGHHVAAGMAEDKGDEGNTVYQIQADYQDPDKADPNSYLRYMKFSPSSKTVKVWTYSPHLDKNKDDTNNQFTIKDFEFTPAAR